jgi:hypothetical protein
MLKMGNPGWSSPKRYAEGWQGLIDPDLDPERFKSQTAAGRSWRTMLDDANETFESSGDNEESNDDPFLKDDSEYSEVF